MNIPSPREIAQKVPPLSTAEREALAIRARALLAERNAVLLAHYYTHEDLQTLAEETGGCVADSLEMARFGKQHEAGTIVVAGVRFMGETAKILSPEKRVLMPDLAATCSLDLGCAADEFSRFCDSHPDRTVVVYANTSTEIKARADWVVTSGIALSLIEYLHGRGEKILWAPDRFLGSYAQRMTGADMICWQGSCVVHERFRADALRNRMVEHPDAVVLAHPESPPEVIELAHVVGSTTALIEAVEKRPERTFIVATDMGIFHKMRQIAPEKTLLAAPIREESNWKNGPRCPWMAMNGLGNLVSVLETGQNEIYVEEAIRQRAVAPLERLLAFSAKRNAKRK
uniref:Quinolinate synthase n=1 Tax=Candidatus Kentrum sp. MB TaxID=2138164 RepID=A0A451BF50_9GAMM|nr:MAG: quinolinate synthetase [Candidatus Kentron sp. MB]VFK76905.1 MAG: quinolinate synthetase [Candidatus Kentron sp. MB]